MQSQQSETELEYISPSGWRFSASAMRKEFEIAEKRGKKGDLSYMPLFGLLIYYTDWKMQPIADPARDQILNGLGF